MNDGDYCGGCSAIEEEFWFSYYGPEGEVWFPLGLATVSEIVSGGSPLVTGRAAWSWYS